MPSLTELNANELRVTGYLVAAGLSLVAAAGSRRGANRRLVAAWSALAILMLVLGLARVIDFGPWLTSLGRHQAEIEGWYDDRREVQFWAVLVVAGASLALAVLLAWRLPRATLPALPASIAATGILGFVVARAISFHDLDRVLYHEAYNGLLLNTVCELGLLVLFVASVAWGLLGQAIPRPAAVGR